MKKRITKLITAALLVLLLPLAVLSVGASLPGLYGETYYGVLPRMYHRLKQVEGQKILVIGGSNVAFGLDGGLLEELLAAVGYDYTVCPFGLYAAVGTGAMLDLSRDTLREGDIVVLAIEPTSDTMSDYFGAETFWKCAEDAPELIAPLAKERRAALAGNYIPFVQERCAILRSGDLPAAQGVYAASSFDETCNLVYDRPGNGMAAGFDPAVSVDFAGIRIGSAFAELVRDYCAHAEKQGAQVVLSFSPVNRSCITDLSEDAVAAFFDGCCDAFGCPVISAPNRYILDSGWFYDSNFHLNTPGAQLRTCLLAEDLLPLLGCYREPEYALPEMPPSAYRMEVSEADGDCFTYVPGHQGAGLLISGITETGLGRTVLHVPASHEGQPVLGFTDDALEHARALEELWIPGSVTYLQDGLFREARNLTRLMLEHRDAPCNIGENPFPEDTELRVYVPAEAYPLYRDGYGCETNPWSRFLDLLRTY